MMYIFPRQFGLHNAFTSQVNPLKTAQKFQDYTLREEEITLAFPTDPDQKNSRLPKIPKRLRGDAEHLVQRLQILHSRCSYLELLKHYCPCPFDKPSRARKQRSGKVITSTQRNSRSQTAKNKGNQRFQVSRRSIMKQPQASQYPQLPQYKSLVDLAIPSSQVSVYCQAVLAKIIPDHFWGEGEVQSHNKATIMGKIDHFVKLRRFETMSLHEIYQDLKV